MRGISDFGQFIRYLEAGEIEATPLETAVMQIKIPITSVGKDAFSRSLLQQASYKLELIEEDLLPQQFHEIFKPHWPLAITPLVVREQAIGLIIVDNKFTDSPITYEDLGLLRTYANTAALGIDRMQLLQRTKQSRDYFQTFFSSQQCPLSLQMIPIRSGKQSWSKHAVLPKRIAYACS